MRLFSSLPWTSGLKTKEIHAVVNDDEPVNHSELFLNQPRDPQKFSINARKKFLRLMLVFILGAIPHMLENLKIGILTLLNQYVKGPQRFNESTQTYYREQIHPAHASELSKLKTGAWTTKLVNEGSTGLLVLVGIVIAALIAIKIFQSFI